MLTFSQILEVLGKNIVIVLEIAADFLESISITESLNAELFLKANFSDFKEKRTPRKNY